MEGETNIESQKAELIRMGPNALPPTPLGEEPRLNERDPKTTIESQKAKILEIGPDGLAPVPLGERATQRVPDPTPTQPSENPTDLPRKNARSPRSMTTLESEFEHTGPGLTYDKIQPYSKTLKPEDK